MEIDHLSQDKNILLPNFALACYCVRKERYAISQAAWFRLTRT